MKKIILMVMIAGMFLTSVSANSNATSIYFEETDSAKIISQLYENKNVKTYKLVIDNAFENSHIDVIYYIDDEIIRTDDNVLIFQDNTSYFIVGTTLKKIILRPDKRNKGNTYGQKDVSKIDEKFAQALQNIKYIRKEKKSIMSGDLIIQFEYLTNNHIYRIDFKYAIYKYIN